MKAVSADRKFRSSAFFMLRPDLIKMAKSPEKEEEINKSISLKKICPSVNKDSCDAFRNDIHGIVAPVSYIME